LLTYKLERHRKCGWHYLSGAICTNIIGGLHPNAGFRKGFPPRVQCFYKPYSVLVSKSFFGAPRIRMRKPKRAETTHRSSELFSTSSIEPRWTLAKDSLTNRSCKSVTAASGRPVSDESGLYYLALQRFRCDSICRAFDGPAVRTTRETIPANVAAMKMPSFVTFSCFSPASNTSL
jgi:hypothetical protein